MVYPQAKGKVNKMATRAKFRERKNQRRQEAKERQTKRDKLGDKGQLDKLIKMGYSECREAKRLKDKIKKRE